MITVVIETFARMSVVENEGHHFYLLLRTFY